MPSSHLERLPIELLQPIFFQSGYNVALLQASSRIGARLSSDYVYNATCSHYLRGSKLDRQVQTIAQTYIFASRWMTWEYFKSWIMKAYAPIGCLCGATKEEGCFDEQWPPDFDSATNMVFSRSHLPQFAFIKARLPKKLLRGPWTSDQVQFLQFLLWTTSMTVNWSDRETRQVAIEGRQQAMREGNVEAVELFNHNRRLGRGANLSTVRFAVLEGGCNRTIVYDTMSMARSWGAVTSWECAELDKWCEERILEGDLKGLWLQAKLTELRSNTWPAEDGLADFLYEKNESLNRLVHEPGDYDGGPNDRLVRKRHKWNQSIRQFGWFYQERRRGALKTGLHSLTRADLGDYWKYHHGTHHAIKGRYLQSWPGGQLHNMWVVMWIPNSDCQGVGKCTCIEEYD